MTLNNLMSFFAINLDHIYVLEQIPVSLRSWDLDYPDCSNQANPLPLWLLQLGFLPRVCITGRRGNWGIPKGQEIAKYPKA